MAPGAGILKLGENGNGISSRWYPETLARRVEYIYSIRNQIEFREGDGVGVIKEHCNRKSVVFFADPPYHHAGRRLYTHWQMDHKKLLDELGAVKGDFIITYDDVPGIRRLAAESGFDKARVPMKNTGHALKHELVIGRDLTWIA